MTKYKKVTPEIAAQLQAIVGAKRFFAGDAVKDDFSHDEMPIYGKYYPEVVCEAESTEEVSAILRVCYDNNIPVTPRGAGTGLVGGCVPLCGGVVLCTTRMNKILSYDMNNLVVHIQPGVLLCDLAADALTHGLMYPPDPGEKTATVGGNVSTNAGGMRAVKYGVTRDYVLAMTVVLPDGRVMELGKTVCKTSSGYSLLHLMIGSEGTLGVITMEDVLEELVGDIWDETDEVEREVVARSDGGYELDGDMTISDFLELLGWNEDALDDADSATVGGWTLERFGTFPKPGDSFRYENLTVTVLAMDGRRVERVLVQPDPDADKDA